MNFEHEVLQVVNPLLQHHESADFFQGTLFITADEPTARRAFSQIFVNISKRIQIARVGNQFAIDFVA